MIAVADTSPLRYLILVKSIEILPSLFAKVAAPPAVLLELSHPRSPEPTRAWATAPPKWLEVNHPREVMEIARLGLGEREAISLAQETAAEILLIDDRDAAREARRLGFTVLGTLALLDAAANRGLVSDLPNVLNHLTERTNFRVNDTTRAIIQRMLERDLQRRRGEGP